MAVLTSMTEAIIRHLTVNDGENALRLYTELTFGPPANDLSAFARVINHPGTSVLGAFAQDTLVAMVTLHLLPNVTMDARPYALIENVVTTASHRRQGIGRRLLDAAAERAWAANCYKIMLLTGAKRGVEDFYCAAGFSSEDKTAMVLRRP
ncbi:GNAT family N-acetyltransferase [Yoonia litorea]|uniref:Acetyltransferase (GNAT) family protein n=1 Tax=Yoonia litorea TaxID=1123755 RepID=A0A1I6M1F5_9RHOB|nr:GNAT family N-acetyltransferase [Yoonia litorea]SFS09525.1 Acetyltransferase (GNAT) family protein [Yoonia litorea]